VTAWRARERWEVARAFALTLPEAAEDDPWDVTVVKARLKQQVPPWRKTGEGVYGPMFLWLGRRDDDIPAAAVKLPVSRDMAMSVAGGLPTTTSGLGQWGWVTVQLARVTDDLMTDWIEESYRSVVPKRLVAALEAQRRPGIR
jgi:hypothetical protein